MLFQIAPYVIIVIMLLVFVFIVKKKDIMVATLKNELGNRQRETALATENAIAKEVAKAAIESNKQGIELATTKATLAQTQMRLDNYEQMQATHDGLIAAQASIAVERDELTKQLQQVQSERDVANFNKAKAEEGRHLAERNEQSAMQNLAAIQLRMQDWEKQKQESVAAAREAIMKVGGEMSSKLLADHKLETEQAKQHSEERVRKTTEDLFKQFSEVTKEVHSLQNAGAHTQKEVELMMRSLTNPAGAGQMAEIGLENLLKNLGLTKEQDYKMQYHVATEDGQKNIRPDAVIFLPQDMVMVIDCKASKSLLELAQAQDEDARKTAIAALKKTMNLHLSTLAGREYEAAIRKNYSDVSKIKKISNIFNVMYLPSESAIDQIREADSDFDEKLQKYGIILAGPASLQGLCLLAKMQINDANKAKNTDNIVKGVQDLMESTINALEYIDKVGKGIKSAADNYEDFTKSVNGRLLRRMRNLKDLGVIPSRNKEIPAPLATYEVRRIENTLLLEADLEEGKLLAS